MNNVSSYQDEDSTIEPKPALETVITALKEQEGDLPTDMLIQGLSDLSESEVEKLMPIWRGLEPETRRIVMQILADECENDYSLDYTAIAWAALADSDPQVRQSAIEALTPDESVRVMRRLIEMAQHDAALRVRTEATRALGRFILAGELNEIPANEALQAQQVALSLYTETQPLDIRCAALEAISNCSRDGNETLIRDAYRSSDEMLRRSAIVAMGHSADDIWEDIILREMRHEEVEVRILAARAAGEIQLGEAVAQLARMVKHSDRELRMVSVWALGEIGGQSATKALELAAKIAERDGDDELAELVEEAIGNASLSDGDWANF